MKKRWKIWHTIWMPIVALIPVWIFILIRSLISPENFWQELIVSVLVIIALGAIQLGLLVALDIFLWAVWS